MKRILTPLLNSLLYFLLICTFFCLVTNSAIAQENNFQVKLDNLNAILKVTEGVDARLAILDSIFRIEGLPKSNRLQYSRQIISEGHSSHSSKLVVNANLSIGGEHYYEGSQDSAIHYSMEAYNRALNIGNDRLIARSLILIGSAYDLKGDSDSTLYYFMKGYSLLEKPLSDDDKDYIIATFGNNLGSYYLNRGNEGKAIEYYQDAFEVANRTGNLRNKGVILNNLGNIYGARGDTETAIKYSKESLEVKKLSNRKESLFYTYAALLDYYIIEESYDSLLFYGYEALSLADEIGVDDYKYWMAPFVAVGEARLGDLQKAIELIEPYEYVLDDVENFDFVKYSYCKSYIEVKIEQGDYRRAEEILKVMEQYVISSDRDMYLELYFYKIQVYNRLNERDSVEVALDRYMEIHAEKYSEQLDELGEIEAEYTNYENVQKVASLESEKAVIAAVSLRNKIAAVSAIFVALLSLFFLNRIRLKNKIITEQKDQLESLNQTKDQIFSIIGHDLKKPAIAFRGITEKLKYLIENGNKERLLKFGASVETDAIELNRLTDNLLNWALLQKDLVSIDSEELDIHALVDQNIALFHRIADEKNISLESIISIDSVKSDKHILSTVIRNLLDNAIKYTPQGGRISIIAKEVEGKIALSVQDSGVGMSEDQVTKLFELEKTKSTRGTNGEDGTGLGMHLVQQLVEKINGTIDVASQLGKGSTINVSLPYA